jgi:hypothetical protein
MADDLRSESTHQIIGMMDIGPATPLPVAAEIDAWLVRHLNLLAVRIASMILAPRHFLRETD